MKLHTISAALIIVIMNINYSVGGVIPQRNLVTGNTFKWVVRILSSRPNTSPSTRDEYPTILIYCTGSIISHWNILTAAHCFEDISEDSLTVMTGVTCVHDDCTSGHRVRKIHRHPNYEIRTVNIPGVGIITPEFKMNDVAVLTLATKLLFGPEIGSIPLPTREPSINSRCKGIGWIEDTTDAHYQRLFWTNMRIETTAQNGFSECLLDKLICARSSANDTLLRKGDSGGGFSCDGVVAGILMRGPPKLNAFPILFQTTYYFLPFINDIVTKDAALSKSTECARPRPRQHRECTCL